MTALRLYKGAVQPPVNGWDVDLPALGVDRYLSAESETLENWPQPTNAAIADDSDSVTLANGIVVSLSKITDDATSGFHCARYADVYNGAQDLKRMHSVYIKAGTARYIATSDFSPSTGVQRVNIFDTQNEEFTHEGTFYADHGWEEVETGVYRIWFSNSIINLAYDEQVVGISDGPLNTDWNYSGSGDTIFAGGYMVEAVADSVTEPGPYVKTGTHNGLTRDNKGQTIRQRVEASSTWSPQAAVTNRVLQSNTFSVTWSMGRSSITGEGMMVGSRRFSEHLDDNSGAGAVTVAQNIFSFPLSTELTISIDVLPGTTEWVRLAMVNLGSLDISAYFHLSGAGSIGATLGTDNTSQAITRLTDGSYRCEVTFTSDAADTVGQFILYHADDDNDVTVTADGTRNIFIADAQMEPSASAGPRVKTTTAVRTSAAFNNVIYLFKGAVQPSAIITGGAQDRLIHFLTRDVVRDVHRDPTKRWSWYQQP